MQDKQVPLNQKEKTKVESLEIIVTGTREKPYYNIKYKEVGNDYYNIGYSSYNLDYVFDWKEQYFELVECDDIHDICTWNRWKRCSYKLPEESDYYMACIYDEESDDYDYRKTWFAHKNDYFGESGWRELQPNEKVIAWKALPNLVGIQEDDYGRK